MGDENRPTRIAEELFAAVEQTSNRVYGTKTLSVQDHAYMFGKMAEGLGQLAVGVRATYILLEEVKGLLKRQQKP